MKTKKIKKKKTITQKQKQTVTVNIGTRPAFRTPKRRTPPPQPTNPQVIYKVTPVSQPNFQSIGERVAELAEVNKLASRVRGLESTLSSARAAEGLRSAKPETVAPIEDVVRVKQESPQPETVSRALSPKSTPTHRSVSPPPAKARRAVSLDAQTQVKKILVEKLGPTIVNNVSGIPLRGGNTAAYNDALQQFLNDGNVAGLKAYMKPISEMQQGSVNRRVFDALFSSAEGQPLIDSSLKKKKSLRPQSTKLNQLNLS